MTGKTELLAFFCNAMLMVSHSVADHRLPAPRNLSCTWVDQFNFNVSWSWDAPKHLPDNCQIKYEIVRHPDKKSLGRTPRHFYNDSFLTEEMGSNKWMFSVRALAESCDGWTKSKPENVDICPQKPCADVVKDFKCSMMSHPMTCSWEPVSPSGGLNTSYWLCEEKKLKKCHRFYCDGKGSRCSLQTDDWKRDIIVLAENEVALQTFKAERVMPLPKLNIREEGYNLNLEWTPQYISKNCRLNYTVCYTKCKVRQPCRNYISVRNETNDQNDPKHGPLLIPYDKSCRYEFKFNVEINKYCPPVSSNGTAVEFYGTDNKLPDGTLTVVAIVIPVILSVGVILSCYCFRRHRAILCPTMPDPSAIFKEMMNGNKESKTTSESLYTPVPEPIEHCTITPLTENSFFQQNF